jgi:Transposase DDE domain
VDDELLVTSRQERGIRLIGPPRRSVSWQTRTEGAYDLDHFAIDWERKQVRCPQGRTSAHWHEYIHPEGGPDTSVRFRESDCLGCPARSRCTRAKARGRHLRLPTQEQHTALRAMRAYMESEEGRRVYAQRAGIEGTLSQGVRSFGLRRARYRGEAKAHLQHVATAVALNFSRLSDWLEGVPRAATRVSRFARLAA